MEREEEEEEEDERIGGIKEIDTLFLNIHI